MNNNEARLSELTNGILLIENLMHVSTTASPDDIKKSEYYGVYTNLINERNQLLKELNREECKI